MKRKMMAALGVMVLMGLAGCSAKEMAKPEAPAVSGASDAKEAAAGKQETDFPAGPITLVCPWKAGAGADTICRMFESMGQEYFGVPIVVENQDGAAGVTATVNYKNTAKGDGYSVLFNNGGVFSSKSLMGTSDYTIDDFRPICGIVKDVNVLIVNSSLGINSFEDFMAKYSGTGEKLTVGCATGGIPHICLAQLFQEADITYTQVAYNGTSEIVTALLGGHVDVICIGASEISAVKDSKEAVLLTVFSDTTPNVEGLEAVPPISQFGYDIDTSIWRMLLVNKDTPDEVFQILQAGFTKMIQDQRFTDFANKNGLVVDMKTSEEVTQAVQDEIDDMIPIFQKLKLGIYQ